MPKTAKNKPAPNPALKEAKTGLLGGLMQQPNSLLWVMSMLPIPGKRFLFPAFTAFNMYSSFKRAAQQSQALAEGKNGQGVVLQDAMSFLPGLDSIRKKGKGFLAKTAGRPSLKPQPKKKAGALKTILKSLSA